MTRVFSFILAVVLLFLTLVACSSDAPTSNPTDEFALDGELEVALTGTSPSTIRYAMPTGQSRTSSFRFRNNTASPTTYSVSSAASWLTILSPATDSLTPGATATISIGIACETTGQATGVITITAPTDTKTINVTRFCSGYDITLVFGPNISEAQKLVFRRAAARWKNVLIGDVSNVTGLTKAAGACGSGEPAFSADVDDIVIYADVKPIDGVNNIVGSAGPCIIRFEATDEPAPIYGVMTFDSADVAVLQENGTFKDVILHEMGHVLGIGTLWERQGLVDYPTGTEQPCDEIESFPTPPVFTGSNANAEYAELGGEGQLPLEDQFGPGTQCGHWDETVFDNELMTGFIGSAPNPLSRMTVASLEDLGYEVNKNLANAYSLPLGEFITSQAEGVDIAGSEILLRPVGAVTNDGKIIPLGQ
jgi:hypothetical protein